MNDIEISLLDDYACNALKGLLATGNSVSYDTAHQAFRMAQMMLEVRKQYMSEKRVGVSQ